MTTILNTIIAGLFLEFFIEIIDKHVEEDLKTLANLGIISLILFLALLIEYLKLFYKTL